MYGGYFFVVKVRESIMTVENCELYYELKEAYPEFFPDNHTIFRPSRACGKTLMTVFIVMAQEYSRWFVHKLELSSKSLTREEYENGLLTIEKLLYEGPFPVVYNNDKK
jgi:hypothetical protein